ncbi:hypothetical protein H1R82_08495 [Thermoactinomyces intermedius]|uniref:hypothetical protein n=1 Tax=Thermoactinomyces intermedius TaxID=2024 RepID=UPI0017A9DD73|nr:hypothetical protein [Thermoactinomyces intermedius]MBA4548591.1 hypothetical protein [Thermoactinomyces intermedius]MBA4836665.1 hypothetical protein [Thermoactinomyces intermedius]
MDYKAESLRCKWQSILGRILADGGFLMRIKLDKPMTEEPFPIGKDCFFDRGLPVLILLKCGHIKINRLPKGGIAGWKKKWSKETD